MSGFPWPKDETPEVIPQVMVFRCAACGHPSEGTWTEAASGMSEHRRKTGHEGFLMDDSPIDHETGEWRTAPRP